MIMTEPEEACTESITIENFSDFRKILSPRRLELMKILYNEGSASIVKLSKLTGRHRRNVAMDTNLFCKCGVIKKEESKFYVPWSKLVVTVPFKEEQNVIKKTSIPVETFSYFRKTLSPKRLELLKALHNEGPKSILSLSKLLDRDHRNVRADVKRLQSQGFVLRIQNCEFYASVSEIVVTISLKKEKENKTS